MSNSTSTATKFALVALGAAAVVGGVALYLYYDEEARERVQGVINREKAKAFVRHKLNGSDELVAAVDNLTDAEVNTLIKLSDSAQDAKDKAESLAEDASSKLSDFITHAKDKAGEVSDTVSDYFN